MENAIDALKMAAAILVFTIAITVTFSLLNKAKSTADSIITMRDKQGYLESADLDGDILYTSSDFISTQGETIGVTTKGHRIVKADDVVATITRYNKEKYGVTIAKSTGEVLARFDSNTENIIRHWNNITPSAKTAYAEELERNTVIPEGIGGYGTSPIFLEGINNFLEQIYAITVTGNGNINCGAPWYGNDKEIDKRISAELSGTEYKYNGQSFTRSTDLLTKLKNATKIIEVTNEIDQSEYLKYNEAGTEIQTNLLKEYEMPTIEIIYIIN